MIELQNDTLNFRFPEVHADANLSIAFQRTLRIPDDGESHPLPPGLGHFPLRLVDDFRDGVPSDWLEHGGVMLPMYQAEALWVDLSCGSTAYPFAVKVAAGKINAVTGEAWSDRLQRDPQDYLTTPEQPWLDGFAVEKGVIRQFVAMPLGAGYSAEEQLTGGADIGGLQVIAYPLKAEVYERMRCHWGVEESSLLSMARSFDDTGGPDMGLAPGGRMEQQIFDDPFDLHHWDLDHSSRCFVHLTNSMLWHQITGGNPPTVPPTAKAYTDAGLPWYSYYEEKAPTHSGSPRLKGLESVKEMGEAKGDVPLPENQSIKLPRLIDLLRRRKSDIVRESRF